MIHIVSETSPIRIGMIYAHELRVSMAGRNEMAQEWKKNEHYVANSTTLGDNIPVEELDDDELLGLSRSRVARGACGSRRLSRSSRHPHPSGERH